MGRNTADVSETDLTKHKYSINNLNIEILFQRLVAHGYTRDYSFLRDTEWSNIRSRTLVKRDKSRQTGGKVQVMDELDNLVLEIIGRESPVVQGLPVRESFSFPNTSTNPILAGSSASCANAEYLSFLKEPVSPTLAITPTTPTSMPPGKRVHTTLIFDYDVQNLKKRSYLQMEILKLKKKVEVSSNSVASVLDIPYDLD